MILEAARPLVTVDQMKEILAHKGLAGTFVLPLVNTIISKDGYYLDRDNYYQMSTPNAIDYMLLKKAFATGKYSDLTDETRIINDEFGIKPYFILGAENLIKVTYKKDVYIIDRLVEADINLLGRVKNE